MKQKRQELKAAGLDSAALAQREERLKTEQRDLAELRNSLDDLDRKEKEYRAAVTVYLAEKERTEKWGERTWF